jgi:hypothetical protein
MVVLLAPYLWASADTVAPLAAQDSRVVAETR